MPPAQTRLPTISPDHYDADQKKAVDGFVAARGVPISGPFELLVHSPDVLTLARSMGDYLRFKSRIGTRLSELVILVTAREWTQDFEWYYHAPIAEKAGISATTIAAIRDGRRPEGLNEDEAIVYDFSTELHRNRRVSDTTFARAQKRFGHAGVVDLVGVNGYYSFLAMQLNAARFQIPAGEPRLPRFPE